MKPRFWITLAIVVAALLFAFVLTSRRPYLAKQTLSGGTILTLVAIKTGGEHYSPFSGRWHRVATLVQGISPLG